jgi:hypothetical protein
MPRFLVVIRSCGEGVRYCALRCETREAAEKIAIFAKQTRDDVLIIDELLERRP